MGPKFYEKSSTSSSSRSSIKNFPFLFDLLLVSAFEIYPSIKHSFLLSPVRPPQSSTDGFTRVQTTWFRLFVFFPSFAIVPPLSFLPGHVLSQVEREIELQKTKRRANNTLFLLVLGDSRHGWTITNAWSLCIRVRLEMERKVARLVGIMSSRIRCDDRVDTNGFLTSPWRPSIRPWSFSQEKHGLAEM